jgi:protein-disulfide isomerase
MSKHQAEQSSSWIWITALIVVVVSVLGLMIFVSRSKNNVELPVLTTSGISPADHVRGNKDAKTVLLEYGDYQCPACASYDPIVRQIVKEYGDRIAIVYRHFPLRQIHPNADIAAQAAEAANIQGKFFEMHELLYDNQQEWERSSNAKGLLIGYAARLSLDTKKFETDLTSRAVKDIVDNNYNSAMEASLPGTPSFFLNGKAIQNPGGYQQFTVLLDEAIKSNQ